jgi:hypothetical protein
MDWPCVAKNKVKTVPKIFPTNEIARNKICSADLLNDHEWRKVGRILSEMETCTSDINFDG